MAEKYEYNRMAFADALLKEYYAAQMAFQLDMNRTLFWDGLQPCGPPTPAWVASNKMFDDAYTWDPPANYYDDDEGCDCCG